MNQAIESTPRQRYECTVATLRQAVIDRGGEEFCERCGDKLDNSKAVWLELSTRTGLYSEGGVPEEHSQGWFAFGSACARAVLKNGGENEQIRGKRR